MSLFKNPRPGELAGAILIATGLIFIGITALFLKLSESGLEKMTESVNAALVGDNKSSKNTHQPTYQYEVNGIRYKCLSNSSSSIDPEKETTVRYNPEKPEQCSSDYDQKILGILTPVFLGVGGFLNLIGIVAYLASSRKK